MIGRRRGEFLFVPGCGMAELFTVCSSMEDAAPVGVSLVEEEYKLLLSVRDHGIGIPLQEL